jgi:hypothetical protein
LIVNAAALPSVPAPVPPKYIGINVSGTGIANEHEAYARSNDEVDINTTKTGELTAIVNIAEKLDAPAVNARSDSVDKLNDGSWGVYEILWYSPFPLRLAVVSSWRKRKLRTICSANNLQQNLVFVRKGYF